MGSDNSYIRVVAHVALALIVLSLICINATSFLFWKHRSLTLIRFRWPFSYCIWCALCNLYFVSRLLYLFGDVYDHFTYSKISNIVSILRAIGLNGSYLVLLCRIWLYFYCYTFDRHVLEYREAHNSWIIRWKSRLGNEHVMLCVVGIYMAITSIVVIYEEIGGLHIDGFTQIYFGITF